MLGVNYCIFTIITKTYLIYTNSRVVQNTILTKIVTLQLLAILPWHHKPCPLLSQSLHFTHTSVASHFVRLFTINNEASIKYSVHLTYVLAISASTTVRGQTKE